MYILWGIIPQFNIFCGFHNFTGKVIKPELFFFSFQKGPSGPFLMWTWFRSTAQVSPFTAMPGDTSASSTLMILRCYFCCEVSFGPLSPQSMLPPVKCWYNTISRDNFKATTHHNHRLCFKWSRLWFLSPLWMNTLSICALSLTHANRCVLH